MRRRGSNLLTTFVISPEMDVIDASAEGESHTCAMFHCIDVEGILSTDHLGRMSIFIYM